MTLLTVDRLHKEYVRNGQTFAAVDGVSFTLEEGGWMCLMGRSGSGKTTLVGMTAGLISPDRGEIVLDGRELSRLDDNALSGLRNRVVGYVPQGASLYPALNALDNVRLPRFLGAAGEARMDDSAEDALNLLEIMGVAHLKDAFPSAMSGGEMRRVAVARALINSPKLLIADEPTGDLDEKSAHELRTLLDGVNSGGTALLLVTHDAELAAHSILVMTMSAGKLTPAERA